ncbi:hypothetical protein Q31b_07670 [Novipirellula aureliae]|uniref:Uncharacterized protein n=1 Tax=Novipirellula aureliae TaxID=2527966 RepID=A0A5C6E9E4_9BACT|nr:hypothetical protein [Novipirellula aureliae]TWU45592.1 hypothetical protein Q31b_07670 [Novipirellula aureliae]
MDESIQNKLPQNKLPIVSLRIGAFLCFAGWTWAHFYWEGPYNALLWHERAFELAGRLGLDWDRFVGSGADDGFVQKWIARIGWLYLGCTILTLTVRKKSWVQMSALVLGSGLLTLLSYAAYVSSQYQLPMFVEQGGQILMPILLVMALTFGVTQRATVVTAMIAVITTFAGHGCYALGLWPTPGKFCGMTTLILGVEYPTAQTLLRIAGVLDFLVCIGICIPCTRRVSALYATLWGFLTSIARPVAGMSWGLIYWGADHYLHEAVYRAPHFLVPFYLFLIGRQPSKPNKPNRPVHDPK